MIKRITGSVLACVLTVAAGPLIAHDQSLHQQQVQQQERIYGSELMSDEERAEYREKMTAAHTEQERNKIRMDNHKQMKDRAREREK